jgi:hypothetical protein
MCFQTYILHFNILAKKLAHGGGGLCMRTRVCVCVCVPSVDQLVLNLTLSIYGSYKWQLFVANV